MQSAAIATDNSMLYKAKENRNRVEMENGVSTIQRLLTSGVQGLTAWRLAGHALGAVAEIRNGLADSLPTLSTAVTA